MEPGYEAVTSCLDREPVLCSSTFDVIESKELPVAFIAASAPTPIGVKSLATTTMMVFTLVVSATWSSLSVTSLCSGLNLSTVGAFPVRPTRGHEGLLEAGSTCSASHD